MKEDSQESQIEHKYRELKTDSTEPQMITREDCKYKKKKKNRFDNIEIMDRLLNRIPHEMENWNTERGNGSESGIRSLKREGG